MTSSALLTAHWWYSVTSQSPTSSLVRRRGTASDVTSCSEAMRSAYLICWYTWWRDVTRCCLLPWWCLNVTSVWSVTMWKTRWHFDKLEWRVIKISPSSKFDVEACTSLDLLNKMIFSWLYGNFEEKLCKA